MLRCLAGTYSVDIAGVVGEAGAVATGLVGWQTVGGGTVLAGDRGLIDEGSVQTLNVASITHGDVDNAAWVHGVVLQPTIAASKSASLNKCHAHEDTSHARLVGLNGNTPLQRVGNRFHHAHISHGVLKPFQGMLVSGMTVQQACFE